MTVTTLDLPPEALELLGDVLGPDGWRDALAGADALVCQLTDRVDAALLNRAPRLRVVATASVGYEHIDVAACRARGIVVTNTPDVLTSATADLTWALLLAAVRRLPQAERSLRAGEFTGWGFWDYLGGDLEGRTLGIFGMGRIGRAVARRAGGFGMRVIYHSRTPLPPDDERVLAAERVDFDALLARSDVLSLHAPLTPETRHAFDRSALARMRPGSVLVNTARGPLIDEAALVDALRDGPLGAAGLDVFEREPIVHPGLLDLPNVVLLPHIGSATHGTRAGMATLAARNVRAVLDGDPPLTPL
ncbi:MAG TPA: D-glycerate dehydrogenase [Longimicrobium sp.]|nr:D-glycerate dehydrogenase [Longimicrobium sp.]